MKEIKNKIKQENVTGGTASFSHGEGMNYDTPKAFNKKKKKFTSGLKKAPPKKYHTKTFDVIKLHKSKLKESVSYTDEHANKFYKESKEDLIKLGDQLLKLKNIFVAYSVEDIIYNIDKLKKQRDSIDKMINKIEVVRNKLEIIGDKPKYQELERLYYILYNKFYSISWFIDEMIDLGEKFTEEKEYIFKAFKEIDEKYK